MPVSYRYQPVHTLTERLSDSYPCAQLSGRLLKEAMLYDSRPTADGGAVPIVHAAQRLVKWIKSGYLAPWIQLKCIYKGVIPTSQILTPLLPIQASLRAPAVALFLGLNWMCWLASLQARESLSCGAKLKG